MPLRPGVGYTDAHRQLHEALQDFAGDFDIDGILAEWRERFPHPDGTPTALWQHIDDIPSKDFWEMVAKHDQS